MKDDQVEGSYTYTLILPPTNRTNGIGRNEAYNFSDGEGAHWTAADDCNRRKVLVRVL